MSEVRTVLVGVPRFVYGFIVGDDPVVAAVMLAALVLTALLVAAHVNAWWLVPPLAVAMTGFSLWRRRAAR